MADSLPLHGHGRGGQSPCYPDFTPRPGSVSMGGFLPGAVHGD